MDHLPNEVVVVILTKLKGSDLDRCVDVCCHWKDLIDEAVGTTRFVGTRPEGYRSEQNEFVDVQGLGQVSLRSCVHSNIQGQEIPNFRNGYLVKQIHIYGPISQINLNKLFPAVANLTTLMLHLDVLDSFKFGEGGPDLKFPKLTSLSLCIGYDDYLLNLPTQDNNILCANLLTLFLDTEFPQLHTLVLFFVPLISNNPESESSLLDALIVFLHKHMYTLRTFEFVNSNEFINFTDAVIPIIPRIKSLPGLKLTTFCQYGIGKHPLLQIEELFENTIIASQTSLCNCLSASGAFNPTLITQNSSTLVTLELSVIAAADTIIDCKVFVDCTALKFLTIMVSYGRNQSLKGSITNTDFLSKTLESIRIVNFNITTTNATFSITNDWKALYFLEIQYIGTEGDFGVPFYALCALLTRKHVSNVYILNGVNKNSLNFVKEERSEIIVKLLESSMSEVNINLCLDVDKNYTISIFSSEVEISPLSRSPCRPHIHLDSIRVYPTQGLSQPGLKFSYSTFKL